MTVRQMTLTELEAVLDWARLEGWNPGLADAEAFYAADPKGFFVAEVAGAPVASVSVVNHSAGHAFLGLYICKPEYRGKGIGFSLWTEALRHAGTRAVSLDGVPDQQDNYARSGFVKTGRTVRYEGRLAPASQGTRATLPADLQMLMALDHRATGYDRGAYMEAWFAQSDTRQTRVLLAPGGGCAFATYRQCDMGVKVGPLYAHSADEAGALLQACPEAFGAGALFVDVPDGSALGPYLSARGFVPVFETARMTRGTAPVGDPPAFRAVTSLELG